MFVISVTGGDAPRAWAFLDNSNQLVACAKAGTTLVNAYFVAPCNGYFICNTRYAPPRSSCTRCVFEDNSIQSNSVNTLQSQSTSDESVQEAESEVEPE